MGLEGIVSKRLGSRYKSGPSRDWLKTKAMVEGEFLVAGAAPNPGGAPFALAREDGGELVYAGSAFVTLSVWEFACIGDQEIFSATIIVGEPNPLAAAVYDRMPVILEPEDYDRWLNAPTPIAELRVDAEALAG
jgi:putative SOS response-associated peptidase YedK